jgi:hypothetical protein
MDKVKIHHQSRQMFIVIDGEVIIANKGIAQSHFEWLLKLGLTDDEVKKAIRNSLRGILTKEKKLYFYKDFDFSGDTSLITQIRQALPQLYRGLKLDGREEIYAGMMVGKLGEDWEPKVKLGTVNELIGKI